MTEADDSLIRKALDFQVRQVGNPEERILEFIGSNRGGGSLRRCHRGGRLGPGELYKNNPNLPVGA